MLALRAGKTCFFLLFDEMASHDILDDFNDPFLAVWSLMSFFWPTEKGWPSFSNKYCEFEYLFCKDGCPLWWQEVSKCFTPGFSESFLWDCCTCPHGHILFSLHRRVFSLAASTFPLHGSIIWEHRWKRKTSLFHTTKPWISVLFYLCYGFTVCLFVFCCFYPKQISQGI